MRLIACRLAAKCITLRSGGADGADNAFEEGAVAALGHFQIFLPWNKFNDRPANRPGYISLNDVGKPIVDQCMKLAADIHPAWGRLSFGAKKLHARNTLQVLGLDLKTPSRFVVCWTPFGEDTGGTRTAIVLARRHEIPIFNLCKDGDLGLLKQFEGAL